MRILLICNKSPYPTSEGGPMAMDAIIRGLVDAGQDVTVIAASSHKFPASGDLLPDDLQERVHFLTAPVDLRIKPLPALRCLIKHQSYHAFRFRSMAFANALMDLLQQEHFDIIQLESVYMGVYIPLIQSASRCPVVLRAHNVEHRIWERIAQNENNPLKRWYIKQLARSLKNFEIEITHLCDAILPITAEDGEWFSHLTSKPMLPLPFSVDTTRWAQKLDVPEAPSVCHLGAMSWWPNEQGIRWLLNDIWPSVHQKNPQLTLHLAGRSMPSWITSDPASNVVVHGEVADAKAFLAFHTIMVIPLLSGSGMRIKMVEGMLAGLAVISTTLGAEGIPVISGTHAILADKADNFADAILQLAENRQLCMDIGRAGNRLALATFDRQRQSQQLLEFYLSLTDEQSASDGNTR